MKWLVRAAAVVLVLLFLGLLDWVVRAGWPVFLVAGGLWAVVWALARREVPRG